MIARHCGTKKYKKRIFLITDGEKQAQVSEKEKKAIIQSMNESDTRLNVITMDFCDDLAEDEDEDEEQEEQENDKPKAIKPINPNETPQQQANKAFLTELTAKVKGAIFPASVAIQIYQQFKKREVMARAKYRGNMDISRDLKLAV